MLDSTTTEGRVIAAALGLAAEKRWADITLVQIAERAGVTLVDLKNHFASKGEILTALSGLVDNEMLRRLPTRGPDLGARDALFEVVMSRFDVLEPYKAALRSIGKDVSFDPTRLPSLLTSQRWMLEAAGISADGLDGGVRVTGLATVYASVFRTWLDDDDAGLARTMAALDRRLRRGEQALQRADDVRRGFDRVTGALFGAMRSRSSRSSDVPPSTAPSSTPPVPPSPPPASSPPTPASP